MNKVYYLLCTFAITANLPAADVRVAHLSPDAPSVDILGGTSEAEKGVLLAGVPFGTVSDYLPLGEANYFIDVVPSAGGAPVIDVNDFAIADSDTLTIAAVDVLDRIEPLVLIDDNTIVDDKARIRVVHASPGAPNVDVSIDGVGLLPALTGLPFKGASEYLAVDPGAYTFRIRATGDTNDVFVVDDLALEAGTVYSAFAIGQLGDADEAFRVLPTVDAVVPEPAGVGMLAIGALALLYRRR